MTAHPDRETRRHPRKLEAIAARPDLAALEVELPRHQGQAHCFSAGTTPTLEASTTPATRSSWRKWTPVSSARPSAAP